MDEVLYRSSSMIKGMININNNNWKQIDNTNYYISKDAQVYNSTGEYLCNISEPSDKLGYKQVSITLSDRKKSNFKVHKLMGNTWLVKPNDNQKYVIDHIDGNRNNNDLSNLEWVTYKENSKRAKSRKKYDKRITKKQWQMIIDMYCTGNYSQQQIADKYNYSVMRVSNYILGKSCKKFFNSLTTEVRDKLISVANSKRKH